MWKKLASSLLIVLLLALSISCGDDKRICLHSKVSETVKEDCHTFETYGFFNEKDSKNPNVKYSVIWGNVVWGVILIETIIAPIYFFGFSMFEPQGELTSGATPGAID